MTLKCKTAQVYLCLDARDDRRGTVFLPEFPENSRLISLPDAEGRAENHEVPIPGVRCSCSASKWWKRKRKRRSATVSDDKGSSSDSDSDPDSEHNDDSGYNSV